MHAPGRRRRGGRRPGGARRGRFAQRANPLHRTQNIRILLGMRSAPAGLGTTNG
jgi:hypothetical protein